MFVCVCRSLKTNDIKDIIENDPDISMKYIKENVIANCCLCLPEIKRIKREIDQERYYRNDRIQ